MVSLDHDPILVISKEKLRDEVIIELLVLWDQLPMLMSHHHWEFDNKGLIYECLHFYFCFQYFRTTIHHLEQYVKALVDTKIFI